MLQLSQSLVKGCARVARLRVALRLMMIRRMLQLALWQTLTGLGNVVKGITF